MLEGNEEFEQRNICRKLVYYVLSIKSDVTLIIYISARSET